MTVAEAATATEELTLGGDTVEAKSGTWVHMPTSLRHSIQAKTPVVMLLLLLK